MSWNRRPALRCRTKESAFCVRFSPDDRIVVAGHFDGTIVGYDVPTAVNKFEFNVTPKEIRAKLPVTSLSFRPGGGKPLLLATYSNGQVDRWELRSLERVSTTLEEGNEVYAAEYRVDGHLFATAGRDATVRVYDDATGERIHAFGTASHNAANVAASRLYSVTWCKENPNLLAAGGWGSTVFIFDLRQADPGAARKELFGPYLTGDALDFREGMILTASSRIDNRLQLWNTDSGKASNLTWASTSDFLPNCAKLSMDPASEFVAFGGGGAANMKAGCCVLDRNTGKVVVDATFEHAVNTCAFANKEQSVAFGDGEGQVHIFSARKA